VSELHIGGGTPTFLSAQELKDLLMPMLTDMDLNEHTELSFEADPRVTGIDHLQSLHDMGFRRVSLGIQDYDPVVQKAIHREQSPEMVAELMAHARNIGYTSINFDMVYGLPKQKMDSIISTFAHVIAQKPDRIAFYAYAHVPWIELTGQRGFTESDLPTGDEKRALYEKGRELLEAAGYIEVGMDHFALPHDNLFAAARDKKLFRNFMGYVPGHVSPMISLGCSSISDSWTAYIQNDKNIETYQSTVAEGRLPIVKGHILTDEDLYIRQHILNLMTRFETKGDFSNPFLSGVDKRLQEAVNDNLISMENGEIRLTTDGKPFIRNICMAFDARLQRQKPDSRIYSRTI
jgi:oxygen-independent coproporphyrinogen-3 oxidase